MIKENFTIKNNLYFKKFYKNNSIINERKIQKILKDLKLSIDNSSSALNMFSKEFKFNFKINDLKKFKKFDTVVVIGMGGSILGSEAIYQYFEKKIKKKFYFLNNLDSEKINRIKKKIKLKKTLFLIISKSGNTIETISNFLSFDIIKKKSKNIIIISEKKNNFLFSLSEKFDLFFIEHKSFIGGRYSVLSEVGIVPFYLMGLDIINMRKNLNKILIGKKLSTLKKDSMSLANILLKKKMMNLVLINYAPKMEKFLYWLQQLIAESLGKKNTGFFPVISESPKDHHSLLQLYLDGPKDKIFFVFSAREKEKIRISSKKYLKKMNYLNNKTLFEIKKAQKNALMNTFVEKKIPYKEFIINTDKEQSLGELFSYFIINIILVGKLVDINPFDQPAVEQVKLRTKKILS